LQLFNYFGEWNNDEIDFATDNSRLKYICKIYIYIYIYLEYIAGKLNVLRLCRYS